MSVTEKDFKLVSDQIKLLKDRNLKFKNESNCKKILYRYGYYEIINGYKDFLIDEEKTQLNDADYYKEEAFFEHIYSLFSVDKKIRNSILSATLEVESSLRSALSYVVARRFGHKEDEYLKLENYNKGKPTLDSNGNIIGFKINQLFEKFHNIISDDIQPMEHYRIAHGNVPPWIMLKGATFGNLVHFLKLQKADSKNEILSIVTGKTVEELETNPELKTLFIDLLFLCQRFRNRAAHTGRMYNYYSSKSEVKYYRPFHTDIMNISRNAYSNHRNGKADVATLYYGLDMFENNSAFFELEFRLNWELSHHLLEFPEDESMLLTEMGFPLDFNIKDYTQ